MAAYSQILDQKLHTVAQAVSEGWSGKFTPSPEKLKDLRVALEALSSDKKKQIALDARIAAWAKKQNINGF